MKYYLIEISEGDSKIAGKAIYEYATKNEAIATFHSKIGVAMKSDLYASHQIMVINSENGVEAANKYVAHAEYVRRYVSACENDGLNFKEVPTEYATEVEAQIIADGYTINADGTVTK